MKVFHYAKNLSEMIHMLQLPVYGRTKIPDHSLVSMCLEFPLDGKICPETESSSSVKTVRYNLNEIPASFLNDEESFELLNQTIFNIEDAISNLGDADKAYEDFSNLLHTEMKKQTEKISGQGKNTGKKHKARAKPYWSDDLQENWHRVCIIKKQWLSCKSPSVKKRFREEYYLKRKTFYTALRKAKRNYQLHQQKKIHCNF